MNRLSRWLGLLSRRSGTKMRFPQQQQQFLHKNVTTTYSFESVDYEEIGMPIKFEEPPRVSEGQDTKKSFWSRFARSKLFNRKQEKSPKSSRSFSWLPGSTRPSPDMIILQEQLQEDQNQLAQGRLNESDLLAADLPVRLSCRNVQSDPAGRGLSGGTEDNCLGCPVGILDGFGAAGNGINQEN